MLASSLENSLAFLRLKITRGLGPRKIRLLIEAFGSASEVLAADALALAQVEGIGAGLISALEEAKQSDWPERELERAQKAGVTLLPLDHPDYPECLRLIYDPPSVLYVKGNLPLLTGTAPRSLGIVGTRNASEHALLFTKQLAENLSQAKVVINSGLALGIDSAAHGGALKGKTIAVLGSGVDVIYPSQNRNLARQIVETSGAVISEYPLGSRPVASNFPGRNRIITGLSRGIVVVEAGEKSGALITAEFALQEGRSVFAVPGRPGDPRSSGSLKLLKQGAILVDSPEDILEEFSWAATEPKASTMPLSEKEKKILSILQAHEQTVLDYLADTLGESAASLLPTMTLLELKGAIKTLANGRYLCLIQS